MLGSSHSSWWRHTINKHEGKEKVTFGKGHGKGDI